MSKFISHIIRIFIAFFIIFFVGLLSDLRSFSQYFRDNINYLPILIGIVVSFCLQIFEDKKDDQLPHKHWIKRVFPLKRKTTINWILTTISILILPLIGVHRSSIEATKLRTKLRTDSTLYAEIRNQFQLDSTRFNTVIDSFSSVLNKTGFILSRLEEFQTRQFNPLQKDPMYFTFTLTFDYSRSSLKDFFRDNVTKYYYDDRLYDSVAYITLDKINTANISYKKDWEMVQNYLSETHGTVFVTLSKEHLIKKFIVNFSGYPKSPRITINKKNQILFNYDFYPYDSEDYTFLIMKNYSSKNFFSIYDFENCIIEMRFGSLYYDRGYKIPKSIIEPGLKNVKIKLDLMNSDYMTTSEIKDVSTDGYIFRGKVKSLYLKSLKTDHFGIQ